MIHLTNRNLFERYMVSNVHIRGLPNMSKANGTAHSSFKGAKRDEEHFITVTAQPEASIEEQIAYVEASYKEQLLTLGLGPETAVFRRIFLSDVMNQAPLITRSSLVEEEPDSPVAVSIVQQPPLPSSKVSMLAYHLRGPAPLKKQRLSRKHIVVEKNGLRHLWSTRLCACDDTGAYTAAEQTRQVFDDLIGTLGEQGGTLRDDCVRTWIYMKDVDVFYQGMVDSRRELFARHGMNGNSHTLASTGIEGACAHRHDLVAMDAYSVLGLQKKQVSYLNDFDRLCLTRDYNVTFERGTRVAYADRAHCYISPGQPVSIALARSCTEAMLYASLIVRSKTSNGLLVSGNANLGDMKYLIVYLRDPSDYAGVKQHLDATHPQLPKLIVEGAVCRPEWLIEVEGVAVAPNDAPDLPQF